MRSRSRCARFIAGALPQDYDLDALTAAAEGFSGAEIEQVVVAALYAAAADKTAPTQQHLLAEIRTTQPCPC